MPHRFRSLVRLLVLALLLTPPMLAAQDEKVNIRPVPAPNQTIHMKMTQDIDMDMAMDGMPAGARRGNGPMKIVGKMLFEMIQKVGARDAQGQLTAEMTFDTITVDMTTNGNPVPAGNTFAALKGQTLTVVYDGQGNVADVKMPEAMPATPMNFKEFFISMIGRMPNANIGVGETATVPLNLPLPVPMPGGQQMNLTGQNVYTLTSISRDGDNRIANLDHTSDAKLDMPGGGRDGMTMDFHMTGGGTSQWNVDKGFMKAGDHTVTLEGTLGGGPVNMTIRGTMRVTMEGNSR